MQWGRWATGQAGDRAAHLVHSGAVVNLVVIGCRRLFPARRRRLIWDPMSYRVLARAYRSHTFDEIVGQDAVATTLKNAVQAQRIHHGYLFTGTRGVGKTSMARILAKSLNCLRSDVPTVTPCRECDSCLAIAEGEDVDVVEIDAASNTGVDNIRDLRSNATLRPARARFKVYIIDEVHMLSTGAFNALLKTLEEPPAHVKFVLATTEVQKVPATIQSRCQRFDFRAIDAATIAEHLQHILTQENVEAEESVLRRVGRLANGSMRDALSLLDKLLAYEPTKLTSAVVDELLPPPHDELARAVIDCVAQQDAAGALQTLDRALQTGLTIERFCDRLIEHVRTLMLLRVCGAETELVDVAAQLRAELHAQAEQFDAPTYVYIIGLLEELRRQVKFSGAARALSEAVLVRLAMAKQFTDINEALAQLVEGAPERPAQDAASTRPARAAAGRRPVATSEVGMSAGTSTPAKSAEAPPPPPPQPAPRVSTVEKEQAERDPLVQQAKDAVEGTLFDVQRAGAVAAPAEEPATATESAEENPPATDPDTE